VRLPVDLIVAVGAAPAGAAKDATSMIPVVLVQGDAVGFGLVASLARPGGNVTGLTSISTQLNGKRLELLKEVLPGIARVAILWNPAIPDRAAEFPEAEIVARALGLQAISNVPHRASQRTRSAATSRGSASVIDQPLSSTGTAASAQEYDSTGDGPALAGWEARMDERRTTVFRLTNDQPGPLSLAIEPWGDGCLVPTGTTATVRLEAPAGETLAIGHVAVPEVPPGTTTRGFLDVLAIREQPPGQNP
jgi:hypothetical protein